MTMFKLPDLAHRRADAVVALSTQSTNNFDNVHKVSGLVYTTHTADKVNSTQKTEECLPRNRS